MSLLTKISLIVATLLLASCSMVAEVSTAAPTDGPVPLVPVKIVTQPASLYMTCWSGLVFIHAYSGGVIQVLSPNGKPLTC